jgi:hypothetical protein
MKIHLATNFSSATEDGGKRVKDITHGFAVLPSTYWEKYKANAFITAVDKDMFSARYTQDSYNKMGWGFYIIVDCNNPPKYEKVG